MPHVIPAGKTRTVVGVYGLNDHSNKEVIFDCLAGCIDENHALNLFWNDPNSPMRQASCHVVAVIEGCHDNLIEELVEDGPLHYSDWIARVTKKKSSLADEIESVLDKHIAEHGENTSVAKFLRKCLRPIITSAEGEQE